MWRTVCLRQGLSGLVVFFVRKTIRHLRVMVIALYLNLNNPLSTSACPASAHLNAQVP